MRVTYESLPTIMGFAFPLASTSEALLVRECMGPVQHSSHGQIISRTALGFDHCTSESDLFFGYEQFVFLLKCAIIVPWCLSA